MCLSLCLGYTSLHPLSTLPFCPYRGRRSDWLVVITYFLKVFMVPEYIFVPAELPLCAAIGMRAISFFFSPFSLCLSYLRLQTIKMTSLCYLLCAWESGHWQGNFFYLWLFHITEIFLCDINAFGRLLIFWRCGFC